MLNAHAPSVEQRALSEPPVIVIDGRNSSWLSAAREAWQYRELLYFLTWRDIKVRYKQTLVGVVWAIVQPLFLALTLSFFLGRLVKVPSNGVPYPVFVYTAMVSWQLFASALTESSNSLVANERLITKVYFPRLVIPMSAVLSSLVDFAIALLVLIPFLSYYRITPTLTLLALPFFTLLCALIAFGAGMWLAALNVQYRDVRYTLGFLVQLCFFVTPVVFPSSVVPERWRDWYALNPRVGVIEGFRWSVLGAGEAPGRPLLVSLAATVVIVATGLHYFRRTEDSFADTI